jgi:hypothetical protein
LPGIAIGYRVAVLAANYFRDRGKDEELVAVVENKCCAVNISGNKRLYLIEMFPTGHLW